MSTTREWLIELASPLGPLGDPEYRRRLHDALLAGEPASTARRLLDAWGEIADLPSHVRLDDVEGTAADLLSDLAANPSALLEIERALTDPRRRGVALFALGLCAPPSAGQALAALAGADVVPPLTGDELISLASALRATGGGDAARAAVVRLLERAVPADARRDLELALDEMTPR
ncbi:MAG: hypothetical protein JWM10_5281 [Myxococcaceae bacterium]|nr:hypothetical protein [Myxococcaceae bacterium]